MLRFQSPLANLLFLKHRESLSLLLCFPFAFTGYRCRFQLGKARDSIRLSLSLDQDLLSTTFFLALTNFILYRTLAIPDKNGQLLHFRFGQGRVYVVCSKQ